MNSVARWIILLGLAVIAFGVSAVWWIDFVYRDSCHDAGGSIIDGICVGARTYIPWLWDAPWHQVLFSLIPPAVVSGIVVIAGWIFSQSGRRSDV
jgi:hypothetical protein